MFIAMLVGQHISIEIVVFSGTVIGVIDSAQLQGKSSTIARKEGEDAVAVHCLVGFGLLLNGFVWFLGGSGSFS